MGSLLISIFETPTAAAASRLRHDHNFLEDVIKRPSNFRVSDDTGASDAQINIVGHTAVGLDLGSQIVIGMVEEQPQRAIAMDPAQLPSTIAGDPDDHTVAVPGPALIAFMLSDHGFYEQSLSVSHALYIRRFVPQSRNLPIRFGRLEKCHPGPGLSKPHARNWGSLTGKALEKAHAVVTKFVRYEVRFSTQDSRDIVGGSVHPAELPQPPTRSPVRALLLQSHADS
ncbi:hypothetical protein CkaCkLH20_10541 [Colletotrichum karsti]|uniref:Uncharacterized protein n=1 Tax=Colletotrichum karsti TaxID=1095194 RepID=A0A9P6HWQ4_9PEZI|nr:uncharacterized protein CkaCkLH20_10541 [Colletotrichum karsti]KAF9871909.1 hypothetical protein CkaCkLH20_10541 [Colletotrichum karsti]